MMAIEHLTPVDSFYFIIVTLATVGYGDIHPLTPVGKLFVIAIILIAHSLRPLIKFQFSRRVTEPTFN